MKHTLSGRSDRMLMKLLVDAESQRVVGAHILGPDAGEMAQLLAIPMKMGAKKSDFDRTMAVHPSAAEELVTRTPVSGDGTPPVIGVRSHSLCERLREALVLVSKWTNHPQPRFSILMDQRDA